MSRTIKPHPRNAVAHSQKQMTPPRGRCCRVRLASVNWHRGQITAGAVSNAIKTIEKSRSEWGHDRRRPRPHSDVDSVTCHKKLPL
jgi:hypothetical protein